MNVIGYGICGKGEAKHYMRATMEEFKRLCDDTILLLNNVSPAEKKLIKEYGFKTITDNREWGLFQNKIKEDFIRDHVSKLRPDWCVCLDMDEVFEARFTRQELEKITLDGWGFHFYIVNLWNTGHKPRLNFWNVRMWKWTGDCIFENRPLHPGLAPKWAYQINQYAPFILKHYGLKDKEDRMRKVERYDKYDPNAKYRSRSYYEDLKTDDCSPYNEDSVHKEVAEYVQKYKPTIIKKPMTQPPKDYTIIKRTNVKTGEDFNFEVETRDIQLYLKQTTPQMRFEVVGKVSEVVDEMEELFKEPEIEPKTTGSEFKKFTPKRVKKTK